jgi:hypothetical protein
VFRGRMAVLGMAVVLGAAIAPSQAAAPVLGPLLRVTTPESSLCAYESEPETVATAVGTWVAYNDDSGCPLVASTPHFTTVQLLRGGHLPSVPIRLPALTGKDYYSGDPDLAPDVTGDGVLLTTLTFKAETPVSNNIGGLQVDVVRISADGKATLLPSPTVDQSDDKEFLATDRKRGIVYVAWDDTGRGTVTVRALRGNRWAAPVDLSTVGAYPDVAIGPTGQVAVAYETTTGVQLRISDDGGRHFRPEVTVFTGSGPGRADPSCPLRPTIGNRQRALRSPMWRTTGAAGCTSWLPSPVRACPLCWVSPARRGCSLAVKEPFSTARAPTAAPSVLAGWSRHQTVGCSGTRRSQRPRRAVSPCRSCRPRTAPSRRTTRGWSC